MSKKKAKKKQRDATPAKIAAKLVEVGEIRKNESLPLATREKAAKAETPLAHEYLMQHSIGHANATARREAEAAKAA